MANREEQGPVEEEQMPQPQEVQQNPPPPPPPPPPPVIEVIRPPRDPQNRNLSDESSDELVPEHPRQAQGEGQRRESARPRKRQSRRPGVPRTKNTKLLVGAEQFETKSCIELGDSPEVPSSSSLKSASDSNLSPVTTSGYELRRTAALNDLHEEQALDPRAVRGW